MKTLRPGFVATLQRGHTAMMVDDCEVNVLDPDVEDGYGTPVSVYPHSGYVVKGRLQEVQRVPGTPEAGDNAVTVGNYIIKLPWDVDFRNKNGVPTKQCQIVVNGKGVYQVENLYTDKKDRLTVVAYCYEVR